MALAVLDEAHRTFVGNLEGITLQESLSTAGGYRSILGLAKHTAAWSAIYHSYAFDDSPRHWDATDWPGGLRDTIEATTAYLDDIIAWFERSAARWRASISRAGDLGALRPVHWGSQLSLAEIVATVAGHWAYHAGEINEILAIVREEAWEYGEEVEENHVSTAGHGVRPDWMTDEEAAEHLGRVKAGPQVP